MEQYLEEKKASQKRPAVTFQRQDKKKTVYQTPQRSVTINSSQMLEVREQRPQDQRLPKTSTRSSAWSASPSSSGSRASYGKTRKASSPSLSVCFSSRGRRAGGACVVGDMAPLDETVETDSERGD
ncbi:hypothetical protein Taro_004085 [Colocasia esculenta]|uniref:Uncharacterized protein n=1 Tax=Colocasia esculenta TaxID=4460 RepID=A0A843TL44_COLES|nr:hypothetical protein [Colocasia esculenta]